MKTDAKNEYEVNVLGSPCRLEFPRMVIKGKVISEGRTDIRINSGDIIELEEFFAEGLVKKGILKEIKKKAVK